MKRLKHTTLKHLALAGLAALGFTGAASAQTSTLDRVKARGELICGNHIALPGFGLQGPDGRWDGLDIDLNPIGPEHILASGALPPGFPAVEIDGRHYWDGGLVSNSPLQVVLATPSNRTVTWPGGRVTVRVSTISAKAVGKSRRISPSPRSGSR